ncbi:MAG: PspC domain-containing protein [Erythrobacter sp.]|uniref:PspC domain-containing protein n=1 Tax=Erythrobacter sp. TaxID=1042 RepID=UPI003C75B84A
MSRLTKTDDRPPREEFRLDKANAKLMGVCAGAGRYFDIDPTLVRIGLVLATVLLTGLTIPLYIAAALIAD